LSEKTVAKNVLKYGTGGINIDGCRVHTKENLNGGAYSGGERSEGDWKDKSGFKNDNLEKFNQPQGRFPANIILDEEAGKILDEQSGESKSKKTMRGVGLTGSEIYGKGDLGYDTERGHSDNGGASRFFYCAKASKSERNLGCEELEENQTLGGGGLTADIKEDGSYETASAGGKYGSIKAKQSNTHPTVKPLKLMQYLVRLVTPKNGVVLDPFAGSGTTGCACIKEGFNCVLIERDAEYIKIIDARLNAYSEKPSHLNEIKKADK
jgi:site-specific DNA-methyltransferase (adenine-specific)